MTTVSGTMATDRPESYDRQLVSHWSERGPVSEEDGATVQRWGTGQVIVLRPADRVLEVEISVPQRRGQQELRKRALADRLARPFLGRDDDGARLAVPGDDLRFGLRLLDHLGQPRLGVGDRPAARSRGFLGRCHGSLL